MGHCCSKGVTVSVDKEDFASTSAAANHHRQNPTSGSQTPSSAANGAARTPAYSFTGSPWQSPYPAGIAPSPSPARTPGRKFRWPLPPPSPAKPIMSAFLKRQPAAQPAKPIPEEAGRGEGSERALDKSFGYSKNFPAKYELGKEVGRGHFGHTCWARCKKGELKNQQVAVKLIAKAKFCVQACGRSLEGEKGKMATRKEGDGWKIDFSGDKPATPLLDTINYPVHMKNLSRKDLEQVAAELRAEIVYSVAKTGGHLSSSLGVVELTVALHHVFDTPDDKIIWDVGHQAYGHKILTGRRSKMHTMLV